MIRRAAFVEERLQKTGLRPDGDTMQFQETLHLLCHQNNFRHGRGGDMCCFA